MEVEGAVARTEREGEQALAVAVAGEVVGGPEIAGRDVVALDQAVVARHARVLEAGAPGDEGGEVAEDVGADLRLEAREVGRETEQRVVERRLRGGEGEPVAAHIGKRRQRRRGDEVEHPAVGRRRVGVGGEHAVPVLRVPAEILEIEAEDGLLRIDRLHADGARDVRQRVEELHRRLAEDLHLGLAGAGVVEVGEGDVAGVGDAGGEERLEVRRHRRHLVDGRDEVACRTGRGRRRAELCDPVAQRHDVRLARRGLGEVGFVVDVVGHLLIEDHLHDLRGVGIAGDDVVRIGGELVEAEDEAEVLGGLQPVDQAAVLVAAGAIGVEDVEGGAGDRVGRDRDVGRVGSGTRGLGARRGGGIGGRGRGRRGILAAGDTGGEAEREHGEGQKTSGGHGRLLRVPEDGARLARVSAHGTIS